MQSLPLDDFAIFDEFLSFQNGESEKVIANFLNETQNEEAPEGGGSLIFWEETNELQRDVLIKVGELNKKQTNRKTNGLEGCYPSC